MDEVKIQDLIDHCIDQVRRSQRIKTRFEHYILLQCLSNITEEEYERLKDEFNHKFLICRT